MRIRKRFLAVATVGGFALSIAFTGPAWALQGTGTVSCNTVKGSVKFNPPLKNGGTATTETITVKATESNCSSTGNASIVSGKASGTSVRTGPNSNDCASLLGTSTAPLTLTVKWKSTPKIDNSTVKFTSTTGGVDGTGHGTFDTTGSVTSGSYNGDTAQAHAVTKKTASALATACGKPAGLKSLSLASGNAHLT